MELLQIQPALSVERFVQSAWGVYDITSFDLKSLAHYIAYVNKKIQAARPEERLPANVDQLAKLIWLLKTRPNVPRAELLQDQELGLPGSVLDIMVQIMFSIPTLPGSVIGGQLFRPRWKPDESVIMLVSRIFPQRLPDDIAPDNQKVKMQKLSAIYITKYTQVKIQWTDYLSDHLLLSTGINWKTLYIFQHPAFIRAALRSFKDINAVTDREALSRYVYITRLVEGCPSLTMFSGAACRRN
ncbi:hypothetical protein PG991_000540 [Apiospora marii]|uniref:Uncharacterized protein n=1 Tax=Apiospora marii TaxID=335849 RepID=A0ABR1SSA6_9PEZI